MKLQSHNQVNTQLVLIPIDGLELEGELRIPPKASGIVIFAHGSGSSRHSPRNALVAQELYKKSLASLLVDFLSEDEDNAYQNRFDIALLSERLVVITDWVVHEASLAKLPIGYFGASTGAAAAMFAAVGAENTIKALVCRGGRVDLAEDAAESLRIPTLFIVGEEDYGVREANKFIFEKLECTKELRVIPRATHLFEEPGTLERVAEQARAWFKKYLVI
jgi:pimeloyl-ACP methyl ester carboxylesterase